MYDDLVRRLRKMVKAHKEIYGGSTEESVAIEQAADAIDELQQTVERMKAIVIVEAQHTEMFDERDKKTLMEMVKSLPLQIILDKEN